MNSKTFVHETHEKHENFNFGFVRVFRDFRGQSDFELFVTRQ